MPQEENEFLWRFYQDHLIHGRHHEVLRATTTTVLLIVVGGLLGLLGNEHAWPPNRSALPLTLFLVLLGVFGAFFSAKYHERFQFHMNRAREYRNALDANLPGARINELRPVADGKTKAEYPWLFQQRLHRLWVWLHILIAALGVALTLVILWPRRAAALAYSQLITSGMPLPTKTGPTEIYPDPLKTPGAVNERITQDNIEDNICKIGWSTASVRPPTSLTNLIKMEEMRAYGFTDSPRDYELDHLISLQNGGCADCVANPWPEAYGDASHRMTQVERAAWNKNGSGPTQILPGALEKDAVENHIHDEICFAIPNAKMSSLHKKYPPTVSISLKRGQQILSLDWYACYHNMVEGNRPCE